MPAHGHPDPILHCVLQGAGGVDRVAARKLVVGIGPLVTRTSGYSHSADRHDRDAIRHAEDDASNFRRSQPAAHDAYDAAGNGLYLLWVAERPGVILSH